MPIVTWNEAHSVNVLEIDSQHQELIGLVNQLHAAVEDCAEKHRLQNLLGELVVYTRMHFAAEEQLMKNFAYPEYARHRQEHRRLLQRLEFILGAVSIGKYPTFHSDYDVSTDWMLAHISAHDKLLGDYLNSRRVR